MWEHDKELEESQIIIDQTPDGWLSVHAKESCGGSCVSHEGVIVGVTSEIDASCAYSSLLPECA